MDRTINHTYQRNYKESKDEWLTPPDLISALGEFDLDPCAPINRPWPTAKKHYTIIDDGLKHEWVGRVWMNPPYGLKISAWLKKLADHGNGIALVFARTGVGAFLEEVYDKANGIFFIRGKVRFRHIDGSPAKFDAGVASCLIAYGRANGDILKSCSLRGKYINLTH